MPFTGGTYTGLSNSFNDAVSGTIIDPLDWNDLFTDIEAGINAASGGVGSFAKTDVASATTCNIGAATTPVVRITGTTTITSLGTVANSRKYVYFAASLTLTHNATTLILPGDRNIVTAAGDAGLFVSDGSGNWRCFSFTSAVATITSGIWNAGAVTTTGLAVNGIGQITDGLTVGTANASSVGIEVGAGATGSRNAYLDFVGDTTYSDFGLRIIRNGGVNANSGISHRGTGGLELSADDAGYVSLKSNGQYRLNVLSNGYVGVNTTVPGFVFDVNGVSAGTIYDRGGAVYNVKAYGALGDGSTDDATAIQDAIDAAATLGGTVLIPGGGTFAIASTITLKEHVPILVAGGATIKWTGSSSGIMFQSQSTGAGIEGLGVVGFGSKFNIDAGTAGTIFELTSVRSSDFGNFVVSGGNTTVTVVKLRTLATSVDINNTVWNYIHDISCTASVGTVLDLAGQKSGSLVNVVTLNYFANIDANAVHVKGLRCVEWADDNYFINLRFNLLASGASGVVMNDSATPADYIGVYSNKITGLAVDTFGSLGSRSGVILNNCYGTDITGYFQGPVAELGSLVDNYSTSHSIKTMGGATSEMVQYDKGLIYASAPTFANNVFLNGRYTGGTDTTLIGLNSSDVVGIANSKLTISPTSGKFDLAGSISWGAPVTKTADFTVGAAENDLIVNKTGSACTVTLPSASTYSGRRIQIRTLQAQAVNSASSNVIPLAGGSAGTAILPGVAGDWALLVSNGTNWEIMALARGAYAAGSGLTLTGATFSIGSGAITNAMLAGSIDLATKVTGILPSTSFPALTGDITTSSGSTATTIGAGKVTNAMLAGSIAASKLVGTDIATVGTITSGTWSGTTIGVTKGGTGSTTQFTAGSIVFAGASGVYSQDNSAFFWDSTNKRLGINKTNPAGAVHVSVADAALGFLVSGVSKGIRFYPDTTAIFMEGVDNTGLASYQPMSVGGSEVWFALSGSQVGKWSSAGFAVNKGTAANHTLDVNGNIGMTAGGYINFGSTTGASGYGIRDNGGVLEKKNSGGSWVAL